MALSECDGPDRARVQFTLMRGSGYVFIVSGPSGAGKTTRTRTGTSEHGEYYTDDQKVILQKGQPLLVDSAKGNTTGQQLTLWINNDRLLVEGGEKKPAESTIRKK